MLLGLYVSGRVGGLLAFVLSVVRRCEQAVAQPPLEVRIFRELFVEFSTVTEGFRDLFQQGGLEL